jgi:hypothetical protein
VLGEPRGDGIFEIQLENEALVRTEHLGIMRALNSL